MSDLTKQALVESFKKQLRSKPFDKITVSDITDDCGLSRQTFYYHFDNMFGVIRWAYANDAEEEFRGNKAPITWRDGVESMLRYTLKERDLIEGAYNSRTRTELLDYYMESSRHRIGQMVSEREVGEMAPEDKEFVVAIYSYAFVGIMRQWIEDGMKTSPEELTDKIATFVHSSFDRTLMAFRQPGSARTGAKP